MSSDDTKKKQEDYINACVDSHKVQLRHMSYIRHGLLAELKMIDNALADSDKLSDEDKEACAISQTMYNKELEGVNAHIHFLSDMISKYLNSNAKETIGSIPIEINKLSDLADGKKIEYQKLNKEDKDK